MKHSAHITGKSLICSLGEDLDDILKQVRQKKAIADFIPLELARMNEARPYYRIHRNASHPQSLQARFYEILFDTVSRAIADAGLTPHEVENLAIFFGSTSIDIPIYESCYEASDSAALDLFSRASVGYGTIADETARHFDIQGPCYTFATACTSSANAFLYAAAMIATGSLEKALVIGYDLFNNTGFYGFESLRLTAPSSYKPFDRNRDGIIMGEACGAVVLDRKRKNETDFHCRGGATLCDTFNVTTHAETGDVIAAVIRQALQCAGIGAHEIDAVKAHATGSDMNDRTECNGMRQVFSNRMPPVTGLKPFVGHTVGASGVVEMILLTESVKRGFVPATPGFAVPDGELGVTPLVEPLAVRDGNFMLNYFGFGGNCTSLILSNRRMGGDVHS
jgi:3-oxoacyl-(acyl-carrier-protein) synthase